jgi:hypothetical protein
MRSIRLVAVMLLGSGLVWAASPAEAAGSGCPPVFELAPVSILGSNFTGQADNVNHDGMICVRRLNSGGGVFIDNVTP